VYVLPRLQFERDESKGARSLDSSRSSGHSETWGEYSQIHVLLYMYQNFFFHIFSLKNIILYRDNPIIKKINIYRKITLPFFSVLLSFLHVEMKRNSKFERESRNAGNSFCFPLLPLLPEVFGRIQEGRY